MAQQLAETLAALLPTHCPAELAASACPWSRADCLNRADARGELVECWQAVLQEQTASADQRRQQSAK